MPLRDYQHKWFRVPDALTAPIDEVVHIDQQQQLSSKPALVQQVVDGLDLRHKTVQLCQMGQGFRAAEVYPAIYKYSPPAGGAHSYALRAEEDYKGEIHRPAGFEDLGEEAVRHLEFLTGMPQGLGPAIDHFPITTYIPPDFDANIHVMTTRHIYTASDLSPHVGPGDEEQPGVPTRG